MPGPLIDQFTQASTYEPPSGQSSEATVTQTKPSYMASLMSRHAVAMERLARQSFDKTHPVDEYISTLGVPSGGLITIQPTWETPERIESVLAYIPPGVSSALLTLGDRFIELIQQASGFTPTGAEAAFTAAGGSASLPLFVGPQYLQGFDIEAAGNGTVAGNATVTVSNVVGGPFVYVLNEIVGTPTDLSVQYPGNGLLGSGSDPTVTVSAVASGSSGTITLQGQNQSQTPVNGTTVNLTTLGIILNRDDARTLQLTPVPTAGPVHIELMGFADEIYGNA